MCPGLYALAFYYAAGTALFRSMIIIFNLGQVLPPFYCHSSWAAGLRVVLNVLGDSVAVASAPQDVFM